MELLGGVPDIERGGSDAECLMRVGIAFAACRSSTTGESEAETSFGEMIGFEEFCKGFSNRINCRGNQVHGFARASQALPVAGDCVGDAVASEESFKNAVADEEAVVSGRESHVFDWEQVVVPPDYHASNLAGFEGIPSGIGQNMRLVVRVDC